MKTIDPTQVNKHLQNQQVAWGPEYLFRPLTNQCKPKDMKRLFEKDLKTGDILIFEIVDIDLIELYNKVRKDVQHQHDTGDFGLNAAYYLLPYLIAWFDPGKDREHYKNIYHAAIWGSVNTKHGEKDPEKNEPRVVQAGAHGIGCASFEETVTHKAVKNVYVYRRKERPANFEDKINQAVWAFYDDTTIKYSYETAWLLAVICSMRYADGGLNELLSTILGKSLADKVIHYVQQLIDTISDRDQKKMIVCSSLVAMIYKNAGFGLEIKALEEVSELAGPHLLSGVKPELLLFGANNNSTELQVPNLESAQTIVTPRQLTESPDVELVGYLPHEIPIRP